MSKLDPDGGLRVLCILRHSVDLVAKDGYFWPCPGTNHVWCVTAFFAALEAQAISVPVLTGSEAKAIMPARRSTRLRTTLPDTSTGRPETSKEFAKRIKRVVLHGPRAERQEGGSPAETPQSVANDVANDSPESPSNAQKAVPAPDDARHMEPEGGHPLPEDIQLSEAAASLSNQFLGCLSENTEGIDLPAVLRGSYNVDPFFSKILEAPKQFKNFWVEDGLVFLKEQHRKLLCVPNVVRDTRSIREIIISHGHSLLAHLGAYKTLGLLKDHVWWKSMASDVQKYCDTCKTCKRSKPSNQKPYGLLNPLSMPSAPWEAVGIDFVGPLPESKDRNGSYDSITVIIDLLTGMVHLVPSRTNHTAKQVAELVFAEVYKHHGLPRAIVSDRDVLFTSLFWTHLHKLLGVELRMSSAYHPESDGSTERANRTVTQMLRQCVGPSQKDWVAKLPAIEFAINSARSNSTGYAPFFLNTGRMPRTMIWDGADRNEYPGVRAYAQRVKAAIVAAHDSILASRVKQTRDANRRCRPAPFTKDDLVYISTKNISLPKGLARKLAPKFIGPYKIVRDFGNNSYRIDLPSNLRRRGIHDVFHASLLRIHEPNDDRLFPGRLDSQITELEDQDGEWAIDKLVAHRGSRNDAIFEVIWKSGDRTWIPYPAIAHLPVLKVYFEALGISEVFLGALGASRRTGRRTYKRTHLAGRRPHSSDPAPEEPVLHPLNSSIPGNILRFLANPIPLLRLAMIPQLPNNQLQLFARYDRAIRDNNRGYLQGAAPGGYDQFCTLWARDTECPYQFSRYAAGLIEPIGLHLPVEYLAPALEEPSHRVFTPEQLEVIDYVLWDSVQYRRFQRECRAKSKSEEQSKKRREPDAAPNQGVAGPSSKGKEREAAPKKAKMTAGEKYLTKQRERREKKKTDEKEKKADEKEQKADEEVPMAVDEDKAEGGSKKADDLEDL
ncbi:Transposon Ty3-I Gag-Pol polyprotein [Grifola frondosa]|uniref:Transposon Ty3-I Gag-Pol polyprotein n=1 Tax=Grifola frondosa TaxID=5627 RepID=A0A1C7LMZ5_GRIFR|nr:Transposon Ty3-I Gag-Pol polyprotein [Grifola frondosa]